MKCDDDSFINVPNLIHILLGGTVPVYNSTVKYYKEFKNYALNERNRVNVDDKNLMLGKVLHDTRVFKKRGHKWFVPDYLFSGRTYPDYPVGSGYVLSFNAVKELYAESLRTPIYPYEDVFLGFLAEQINLNITNNPLFFESFTDPCGFRGMVCLHRLPPWYIEKVYNEVIDTSKVCARARKKFSILKNVL
jgi:beta-1,3-galactosyltransferase 1